MKKRCPNPEGSIAEGYVADECLTFCSRYLGVFIRLDRPKCNSNSLADMQTSYLHGTAGSILGKVEVVKLDGRHFFESGSSLRPTALRRN